MFSIDSEMKYLHVFPFGKTFDKSWERKYFNVLLQGHCMRMKSLDDIEHFRDADECMDSLASWIKPKVLFGEWRILIFRYKMPLTLRWVIIAVPTLEAWVYATKYIWNVNEDEFRDASVTQTSLSRARQLWLIFRLQYDPPQRVAILYSGSPVLKPNSLLSASTQHTTTLSSWLALYYTKNWRNIESC